MTFGDIWPQNQGHKEVKGQNDLNHWIQGQKSYQNDTPHAVIVIIDHNPTSAHTRGCGRDRFWNKIESFQDVRYRFPKTAWRYRSKDSGTQTDRRTDHLQKEALKSFTGL